MKFEYLNAVTLAGKLLQRDAVTIFITNLGEQRERDFTLEIMRIKDGTLL